MSEGEDNRLASVKKEIVALVKEHWDSSNKVLLLATLGKALMQRGVILRTVLRGQKLVPFLQAELKDQLTVLR